MLQLEDAPEQPDAAAAPAADVTPVEPSATDLVPPVLDSNIPADPVSMPNAVNPGGAIEDIVANSADAADAFSVSPLLMFFIGVGLLGMLLYYWSSESMKNRRIIGTILTVVISAASVFFFQNLGIKEGIELRGGIAMTIQIQPANGREVTPESQDTAIAVMRKRLDARGTSEVVIAKQGDDRVFIQIPGVQPEELPEIEAILSKVARLNFYIVARDKDPTGFLAMQVNAGTEIVPGYKALPQQQKDDEEFISRYYLVPVNPDMPGKHVTKASARFGDQGYEINVGFDGEGTKIMTPLSRSNVGEPMAIVLDDEVLSAPTIESPLTDGCRITGQFSREEAINLASSLENPLENEITILNKNYISPTMGKKTVDQGKLAGIAGLALTLLFIMVYYRFAGVIALVGLLINVGLIFGAMALFKFTLTLPGIAGIILTIGIAIDASVLIYERLREEMEGGKSLPIAIKAAYDKAFSAIFDANITTLITAVILYIVASGTVKGFAVTLIIGILASLFSALLVTRVAFNWATETGFLKKMTFMNLMPTGAIDFLSNRKKFIMISAALIVVSLILVPSVDPRGVDLKGGSMITIEATAELNQTTAKEALKGEDLLSEPTIQTQHPIGSDSEFVTIRVGEDDAKKDVDDGVVAEADRVSEADKVISILSEKTGADLSSAQVETVGSLIGNEMLRTSLIALGIALIAILIWVTFRFEFAFALAAIVALIHDLILVLGLSTIFGLEVSLITVGAFLTIAGYSINDTIVVFDRVREGLQTKRGGVKDIMNYCLNATLGRTLLTSLTTLTVVITLAIFGGPALRNFACTLIIGVLVGTYSSIFIASPIVLWWTRRTGTNLRREILDAEQAKIVGPAGTEA